MEQWRRRARERSYDPDWLLGDHLAGCQKFLSIVLPASDSCQKEAYRRMSTSCWDIFTGFSSCGLIFNPEKFVFRLFGLVPGILHFHKRVG